jgi:adenylyltransferase/sulfurtransferase
MSAADFSRYQRQMLLPPIGAGGQQRLRSASVLIVGCGALGCGVADALARAGVGRLVLADRDVVERTNLHRQVLFDEQDAAAALPKAEAAAHRLAAINPQITVQPHILDVNHATLERLLPGVDLLIDGLDNFQTRFLLNDVAVERGLPYIYGGAVATRGMVYPVLPHVDSAPWVDAGVAGPCLRCLFEDAPAPGTGPTCDTVGVLGPLISVVTGLQATEAIKVLVHDWPAVRRTMFHLDVWTGEQRELMVSAAWGSEACPCCGQRRFDYLAGRCATPTTTLCGRDAVQIHAAGTATAVDLDALAQRLAAVGEVQRTRFMLRLSAGGHAMTVFPDGRAIIAGTTDPAVARSLYARYIGV